jgi:hypothetical protein
MRKTMKKKSGGDISQDTCSFGRLQQFQGTCWFTSTINILLLNDTLRNMIIEQMYAEKAPLKIGDPIPEYSTRFEKIFITCANIEQLDTIQLMEYIYILTYGIFIEKKRLQLQNPDPSISGLIITEKELIDDSLDNSNINRLNSKEFADKFLHHSETNAETTLSDMLGSLDTYGNSKGEGFILQKIISNLKKYTYKCIGCHFDIKNNYIVFSPSGKFLIANSIDEDELLKENIDIILVTPTAKVELINEMKTPGFLSAVPKNETVSEDKFIEMSKKIGQFNPNVIKLKNYIAVGANISISWINRDIAHAIAGFRCHGKYWIYDSNKNETINTMMKKKTSNKVIEYNWSNGINRSDFEALSELPPLTDKELQLFNNLLNKQLDEFKEQYIEENNGEKLTEDQSEYIKNSIYEELMENFMKLRNKKIIKILDEIGIGNIIYVRKDIVDKFDDIKRGGKKNSKRK